ncbi:MAG: indole-3-glycerol phosphate synthase TrpC [Gemmatimonadetes bacterium]|nr:indole-3-glycerol phosphate synthase TrpC [Gemmatimonadota bacterium]
MLDLIVRSKLQEVASLQGRRSALSRAAGQAPAPRSVWDDLAGKSEVAVIAEVKRRSPSAGSLADEVEPALRASAYVRGGAWAISVLTDGPYFGGSLDDLVGVRAAVDAPVLRKDFVIDELQLLEARAAGADLVLLIARILEPRRLATLRTEAETLGLTALVEIHGEAELAPALDSGARLLGINNRDLDTFRTDLAVTKRMMRSVPAGVFVVSESGIRTPDDVVSLADSGAHAVLVGEALMRSEDPEKAVRDLSSVPRVAERPS